MKKFLSWIWNNILFLETLFLLAFIPLYPKLPLVDIKNTWVYIRAEDFVVFVVIITWFILLIKKKVSLKTPLTIPIFIFWIIGAIATFHGILVIFPTIPNVFPNVAFLSLVRHIEYLSLFFIAYEGIKDKERIKYVITVLALTLLGVSLYGFGQKYLSFPAFLTMNEEFAKGIPITLSSLSRVPSTFAGHYDLAAYLVLVIPIIVSLIFGVKNYLVKIFLIGVSLLGFAVLFMTVSRVSFFVLFISLFIVLFFQKRKLVLFSIPLILLFAIFFLTTQSSLFSRFKSTVSEVNVLVDAKTGESVGHVVFKEKEYFKDKSVLQRRVKDKDELSRVVVGEDDKSVYATSSAIVPFELIPREVPLVQAVNISTGESLGQGTGYTNLYLSPVIKRVDDFYYELPPDYQSSPSAQVLVLRGDFIIKRAAAYDLSFTTRFQGEWPNAVLAFNRNLLVGSGYGSVSLAVDNNYLRMLGEIGILGFLGFFSLFISLFIYIKKTYSNIDSKLVKSFVLGFTAGLIGLMLNATLIDVFEASKIAFLMWLLFGVIFAVLNQYLKKEINLFYEIKKAATSNLAIVIYLLLASWFLYSNMLSAYFIADDFTWLRWAADCTSNCSPLSRLIDYLTNSNGFFYRPGTKLYFYVMYEMFWLNQVVYHAVSLILHFIVSVLFFMVAKKVLKNYLLAAGSAFIFLILSGATEAVFWISVTGHLFNVIFIMLSLIFYIYFEEKKKWYFYLLSFLSICMSLLFYELGIVAPLIVIAYKVFKDGSFIKLKTFVKDSKIIALFIPIFGYLLIRFLSQSHWFNGDYSYNLFKLPFNILGNTLGYVMLTLLGSFSLSFYNILRNLLREQIILTIILLPLLVYLGIVLFRKIKENFSKDDLKIIYFGVVFFFISLIPFIGFGNITSRYSYLASMGIVLIFVIFLKRIYSYLLVSGKNIAILGISVFVCVFVLFHTIYNQQSYTEWLDAGNKAKNFFISLEAQYKDFWSTEEVNFHFVDVPIKFGDAWIFPVGLNDAVWFAVKNPKIKIFQYNNLDTALDQAGDSRQNPVFEFNDKGAVERIDPHLIKIN